MFDPTKVAALKTLGFSDADIAGLQSQAEATEKEATEQQIAFKADEPPASSISTDVMPGERFKAANGDEYIKSPSEADPTGAYYATKAFPPKAAPAAEDAAAPEVETKAPLPGNPAEDALDGGADDAMETPDDGAGDGLTLSPEDIAAIGQAVAQALTQALGPLVSTMDLTNKIGGHMDELKSMMGSYQTKKDSADAEKAEQIEALKATIGSTQAKLDELLGLQPAVSPRASVAPASALNPFNPADNALLQSVKDQVPQELQQQYANGFEDLKMKLFG